MPNPKELAYILVNGKRYLNWKTISVNRTFGEVVSVATFAAASPSESGVPTWDALKLRVSNKAQIYLAGRKVIDGVISARQPAYNDKEHGLQITVTSKMADIVNSTVDHEKGEFKGYSLNQIAGAVLQPYGIKFQLQGSTNGADKVFPKVNVQMGETVFAFLERLCRFRNVFLRDDADGNLVAYRGEGRAMVGAELELGRNIKAGSLLMRDENAYDKIDAVGQQPGNDQIFGDASRDVKATAVNPAVTRHRPFSFAAEMPGDKQDMQMRANHELAENYVTMLSGSYTVQGWFKDSSTLWLEMIGKTITVYDPFMFPDNRMQLAIQGVTSTQGPEGTLSVLDMCLPMRLGGGNRIEASGAGAAPGLYGSGSGQAA
ncbi:hypothetical protein MKK69_30770 [Methylobacterium sp. J-026]|uniref:contractile injection system protein, VgrG/Pvc8 family n=1 Tax=Methylobacterium sp. J-026 TaxID=2836624 RepID=UPI001FBA6F2E|nr:contractile injection system protein, VgrG/Pvc8 family [Methylobacterium sp. J-026]MCJ2138388.1 hypothetical protein [Methylobacterium sp. J-026]